MPGSVYSDRTATSRSSRSYASAAAKTRPIRKAARRDVVTGDVLHNPFKPEVMSALRSRGGAMWLRGAVEHLSGEEALHYNHGLYGAMKNLGNFEHDFNELFGLSPTEARLNKTLLNRLTVALEHVAVNRHDGQGRTLDIMQFTQACHQCGLAQMLRPLVIEKMFNAIDHNEDGLMCFREWLRKLDSVHPATSRRNSAASTQLDDRDSPGGDKMNPPSSTGKTNHAATSGVIPTAADAAPMHGGGGASSSCAGRAAAQPSGALISRGAVGASAVTATATTGGAKQMNYEDEDFEDEIIEDEDDSYTNSYASGQLAAARAGIPNANDSGASQVSSKSTVASEREVVTTNHASNNVVVSTSTSTKQGGVVLGQGVMLPATKELLDGGSKSGKRVISNIIDEAMTEMASIPENRRVVQLK
ncbi:unnamed protein product [Amoebophrya sp. A25]|nr:unnamed protein product [Amoebophrya sp. A25]|eukprot:GSA25T00026597001.1